MFLSLLNKDSGIVKRHTMTWTWFGLIVLLPFITFDVISSEVCYPTHTVTGQAFQAIYQYLLHILSPVTS